MTARPLPTDTPAAQGVDADGVQAFLDAVEAAPGIEAHSLIIVRHGRQVAAGWWAPYTAGRKHLLYSLSKSFTSAAAGLAVADGLLDLDATVVSYFPEFEAEITDPGSRAMLVRHIASMSSGHTAETYRQAARTDPAEPVRGFLLLPPERAPGTVFAYNQPTTYTLGAIVQRATGGTLTEYLRPRLLDPLGVGEVAWQQHPAGRDLGFSGLHATTDAIARLGLLHLQGGVWEGNRLLPASWVAEATRPQVSNSDGTPESAQSDWQQGYGFQFWIARHGYRGDGAYGQFCVVLPEYDAVIAMTADTELMQQMLNLMWRHLLPAFGPEPLAGREKADAALADRLTRLELPPVAAELGTPADRDAWSGTFAPEGGSCPGQPTLTAVTLTPESGAGAGGAPGWTLSLSEGDTRLDLRFDSPQWAVDTGGPEPALPTALSAAWTDPDTLTADLILLETPHHLLITLSLPSRTFTATWRTMPLIPGPLLSHLAPRP